MAAPALEARGFVRLALLSIALYFSVVVISSMTMVKSVHAANTVSPTSTYWGGSDNSGFNCTGLASVSAVQSCEMSQHAKWLADDYDGYVSLGVSNVVSCPAPALNDFGPTGNYVDRFAITYYRIAYNCGYGYYCNYITFCNLQPVSDFYIYTTPSCPANTTTTTPPCTCKADYEPDSTATSCVPANSCPVPALTAPPFNDACAEVLENLSSTQAQKDAACGALTPALLAGKACLMDKLSALSPAVPLKVTSDIRSVAYQAHLREIWDSMEDIVQWMADNPTIQTACAARRAEIAAEKGCDKAGPCKSKPNEVCYPESSTQRSHCLAGRPANPSPNDAQHTQGKAFDVGKTTTIDPLQAVLEGRTPPQTIPQFLNAPTNCNLLWGGTFNDPVHFYVP